MILEPHGESPNYLYRSLYESAHARLRPNRRSIFRDFGFPRKWGDGGGGVVRGRGWGVGGVSLRGRIVGGIMMLLGS